MNTKEMKQESISLLADGELTGARQDKALSDLCQSEEGRSTWDVYHQIGDILRADELDVPLSADFATRMKARLDAELPLVMPPDMTPATTSVTKMSWLQLVRRRFLVPSMTAVAAAMATLAFMSGPQLIALHKGNQGMDSALALNKSVKAVAGSASAGEFSSQTVALGPVVIQAGTDKNSGATTEGAMLRDPRIDDYLIAHQRFSPSVYSTAQYARAAMFATDTEK